MFIIRTNNLKEDVAVIYGQRIDKYNIEKYWNFADAFIIGSTLKK